MLIATPVFAFFVVGMRAQAPLDIANGPTQDKGNEVPHACKKLTELPYAAASRRAAFYAWLRPSR
jgi:hypothetical protein